jgi:RNA polymerase sigma factor (sigma-70 family)
VSSRGQFLDGFDPSFDAVFDAARSGDCLAFDQIWHQLSGRVLGFVRAQGASDPEGIVNETFMAVFVGLSRFSGDEESFRSWVFQIARYKVIDDRRRQTRRPQEISNEVIEKTEFDDPTERAVLDGLGDAWVQSVLDQLSDDQRDVLLLRVVADLTVSQVADVLNKSAGAVKAIQRRALSSLRRKTLSGAVPL